MSEKLKVMGQAPAPEAPVEVDPGAPLRDQVVAVLKSIYDPEIPVNIHELGLVYAIDIDAENRVTVRMTLTAPACPVAEHVVKTVEDKLLALDAVKDAKVELVWDPPWTPERMSEAARLQLGMM